MLRSKRWPLLAAAAIGGSLLIAGSAAQAFPALTGVPSAQPKTPGVTEPTILSPGLSQIEVARGSMVMDGGTSDNPRYGYDGDLPNLLPVAGDLPSAGPPVHHNEATKTEPDKNTYLVLQNQTGADATYNYGTHFLFQGHELGSPGFISRINLDADSKHRVTLMANKDVNGNPLSTIDGSTWDPFAQKLLFTTENSSAPEYQATLGYPSQVSDISGCIGRGGYEGIQNDSAGNVWIVEDVGGKAGTVNTHAKQPNSFLYRYVPVDPTDLTKGGKLQALKVTSLQTGDAIAFHNGQADSDILSQDEKDLHTYGNTFYTTWVTIHSADQGCDQVAGFDANTAAKAANATPFKRPENGLFRPGSKFRQFVFDETGDTNALTEAGSAYGGFGGLMMLTQAGGPSANHGILKPIFVGDVDHTGLDNMAFASTKDLIVVEDAGDGLHTQRNELDSAFDVNVLADYGNPATPVPTRIFAEGRDPSATIDSGFSGMPGFQNEGDNEITGMHISDGDPSTGGILGAKIPSNFTHSSPWRAFYTAQHGDNVTYQLFLG
jgi:hypothetical protein